MEEESYILGQIEARNFIFLQLFEWVPKNTEKNAYQPVFQPSQGKTVVISKLTDKSTWIYAVSDCL